MRHTNFSILPWHVPSHMHTKMYYVIKIISNTLPFTSSAVQYAYSAFLVACYVHVNVRTSAFGARDPMKLSYLNFVLRLSSCHNSTSWYKVHESHTCGCLLNSCRHPISASIPIHRPMMAWLHLYKELSSGVIADVHSIITTVRRIIGLFFIHLVMLPQCLDLSASVLS